MEVPEAMDELSEALRGWDEQIWVGSQISHWIKDMPGWYSTGTIGAFVKSRSNDKKLGLLTNMHVGIESGQKLYHPLPNGMHIATTDRVIEWVDDQEWYGSFTDEPNARVRADCAFAKIDPSFDVSNLNVQMMGVGQLGRLWPISLDDMSIIGQRVLRVGRTTGLRRGTITAFGYEFEDEKSQTSYTDLLIVGDNDIPFSTYGDSGSLIVLDNQEMNPVGLLWGGWMEKLRTGHAQENWTYGISLGRVLDALDIDLVSDPEEIRAGSNGGGAPRSRAARHARRLR
jgi:hypothetical protein